MERSELMHVLKQDPWFAGLSAEFAELLLSLCIQRRYGPNEIVYAANDGPTGTFGLLSGGVRMSQYTQSGRHIVYSTFIAGTWFGALSDFDGLARPHNALTVGPTVLLHLPSAAFRDIIMRDWRHCFEMARCLASVTRVTVELLARTRTYAYTSRVAQILLAMSDHAVVSGAADRDARITHDDLAATVDVTRQTIGQLLTAWEQHGLIKRRYGRIQMLDYEGLARLSMAEDPD